MLLYPPIVNVEWTDVTNIANWEALSDVHEWAPNGGFVCRSIGYLTYIDDECVVLSARVAISAEPKQHGLFERFPRAVVTSIWVEGMIHGWDQLLRLASETKYNWVHTKPKPKEKF